MHNSFHNHHHQQQQEGQDEWEKRNKKENNDVQTWVAVVGGNEQSFVDPKTKHIAAVRSFSSIHNARTGSSEREDEDDLYGLEEDIYNIMFLAEGSCSSSVGGAVIVFVTQMMILGLAITDMKRDAPDENPYKLPIDVPLQVIVAQYVATIVATMTQADIFTSLHALMVVGYDASILDHFAGATYAKWVTSNVFRLVVGLTNMAASFLIIVQADDVLDIFKDFAALYFITELDNVAFWLADIGYFGDAVKRQVEDLKEIKLLPHSQKKVRQWLSWFTSMTILLLMLAGLSMVRVRQDRGYYLKKQSAHSISVTFGDEVYAIRNGTRFDFGTTQRNLEYFNCYGT